MYALITKAPENIEKNRWLDLSTTNAQHHAFDCISSSHLKYVNSGYSMESYKAAFLDKTMPFESSKEFTIGTIGHLAVLEPEKFEKQVIVCDIDQRTNLFKEYLSDLCKPLEVPFEDLPLEKQQEILALRALEELKAKENPVVEEIVEEPKSKRKKKVEEPKPELFKPKKTKDGGFINSKGEEVFIVNTEEMEMFRAFQKRFDKHPRLSVWRDMCVIEQTGVAQDPETGLWMSLRGDARCDRGFFLDPKTIADALSTHEIEKYTSKYGLALQAAHYLETANLIEPEKYRQFFFVFMSKKAPYDIALAKLDDVWLDYGLKKRREILNKIADCQIKNRWPTSDYNFSSGDYGMTIKAPAWCSK